MKKEARKGVRGEHLEGSTSAAAVRQLGAPRRNLVFDHFSFFQGRTSGQVDEQPAVRILLLQNLVCYIIRVCSVMYVSFCSIF